MNDNIIKKGIIDSLKKECSYVDLTIEDNNLNTKLEPLTSLWLSKKFSCSRNLISHYMNDFLRSGEVVKVNTRPVYFFWKESLEKKFNIIIKENIFDTLEDLIYILKKGKKEKVFEKLIGAKDSLSFVVEQCKAAITYPNNGLPILLQGPTGIGKTYIAQIMYNYAIEVGILNSESKFVTVNCSEYSNNPEMLMTNLFGYKKGAYTGADRDTCGLLALADGGILFMDEVHGLKPECQEKIFLFMDKGIYHMVGDNSTWYESKARLIFATTEQPDDVLLKTLLRRIPLIVKIPSLVERPIQEKKELIQFLLREEERQTSKKISISRLVYEILEKHVFTGNIGELKNCIKASVAKAFLKEYNNKDCLEIHIYDLPSYILESIKDTSKINEYDDRTMITNNKLLASNNDEGKLYALNNYIVRKYNILESKREDLLNLINNSTIKIEQYTDYLFIENKSSSPKINIINNLLVNVMNIIVHKYRIEKLSNNQISMLAHFINDYMQNITSINRLRGNYRKDISQIMTSIKKEFSLDFEIVTDIWQLMEDAIDFKSEEFGILDMFLFFRYFNREMQVSNMPVVIIAHGYSIASGIAEVSNQLLKQHVFDAIDMPIESDINSIVEKLRDYLKLKEGSKEIIVMVDMGSLEEIHKYLQNIKNMDIGIINNVTTKLALDIGCMIMEHMDVIDILKEASERNQYRYKVVNNRKKEDAIITVCETGIGTAEKISKLISDSLPKDIPISLIPYSYDSLVKADLNSLVFEKYNILFIVGTINPSINGIQFIDLEEMIEQKSVDKTNSILSNYMNFDEINEFNQNMIKNFSLDSLLNYLTILDSEKIIHSVERIINEIQNNINVKLSGNIIVGLYIHIGCLIERLIIDKNECKFEGLEIFIKKHGDFIKIVKHAFRDVEIHYNIEIPLSEIGYIYEYIYSRNSIKAENDSVNNLWDTIESN